MPKNWPSDTVRRQRNKNAVDDVETADGFTKVKLASNISLDCFSCGGFPREFYWKTRHGKQTEVYCLTCERVNRRGK